MLIHTTPTLCYNIVNAMLDTNHIKKDFPVFQGKEGEKLVYLDSSATSQTPKRVLDAVFGYYQEYRANIHRGQYKFAERADKAYEDARASVAAFIGADPREIVFTSGATLSSNMLVYSLENSGTFNEGDEIVTTVMEHHSVLVPMQELAKRKKLVLKIVPMTAEKEIDYAEAERLITKKTKLFMFVGVSNVTGTIHDMKRLCDIAKNAGAYSAVDATQAVGHMPVSVRDIGCDFLFFSGHKMCGPTGIGALYGKRTLLEKLTPGIFGGGMIESVTASESHFAPVPHKFEAGTPDISGVIGFGEACRYLSEIGLEKIQKHSAEIVEYALSKLKAAKGVILYCQEDPEKNIGVLSFVVDAVHPHDTAQIFAAMNIATRAGHHCAQPLVSAMGAYAVNRASIYLYSTKEDIDALLAGIKETQETFK